ncbi:hypothetical protein SteCoe_30278 [Stentor coeruleus]|uniref:Uncharacterized protein n=1 Tax=Stentor coeruleus TaxID=5963 RepID=A0A1R2B420_9CILI|nr:hypothetical protein SteCoe_30278 [Stentor coeruleus]
MEYVSVFPFSLNNSGEIVILVRRDGDFYRDLGGHVYNEMSPMHAAAKNLLIHSNYLIVPSNIERLLKKKPIANDESIFREVLAKLLTLPSHMCIRNIANHFGYLYPIPYIDPEILNTTLEDTSLHWIRISILFSIEEYQRFFSAFDLAILGQVNSHLLKQSIVYCKEPIQRITHYIGVINLEEEVLWQFHLEGLLLSNLFSGAYRSKEVKWDFYEAEMPTSVEIDRMSCVVVIAWREKTSENILEMLEKIIGKKKLIAIGSAASIVCEMLGGRLVPTETQLELLEIIPSIEIGNSPYMKKYMKNIEQIENNHSLRYTTRCISEIPPDSKILASSKGIPCIYSTNNTLCVNCNPELSVPFVEQLLCPELISQNLLSEETYEIAKKTWEETPQQNFYIVRSICEGFLYG